MTKSEDGSKELYTKIFNIFLVWCGCFPLPKGLVLLLKFFLKSEEEATLRLLCETFQKIPITKYMLQTFTKRIFTKDAFLLNVGNVQKS